MFIFRLIAALVSYDCCNKLLHIWWLKTTGRYSFTVLELEIKNHYPWTKVRASLPLDAPRKSPRLACCSFWWLLAGASATSLQCLSPRSHCLLCCLFRVFLCPQFLRMLVIPFRAHLDNPRSSPHLKVLNHMYLRTLICLGAYYTNYFLY